MSRDGALKSCPFCEGPPCPFIRFTDDTGKIVRDPHIERSEDGLCASAKVFCHECGADGPSAHGICFDGRDVEKLLEQAKAAWNQRDSRHRQLYEASVAADLISAL